MNPSRSTVDSILHEAVMEKLRDLTRSSSPIISSREAEDDDGRLKSHKAMTDPLANGQIDSNSLLPLDFHPTEYSVIVGRGKEAKENPGNKRLQEMIRTSYLERYSQAKEDKPLKSKIVSEIIAKVYDSCPNKGLGAFIKRTSPKNGRWYEVGNSHAREKIGYVFRDLLGDKYRSSSKSKVARRRSERKQQRQGSIIADEETETNTKIGRYNPLEKSAFVISNEYITGPLERITITTTTSSSPPRSGSASPCRDALDIVNSQIPSCLASNIVPPNPSKTIDDEMDAHHHMNDSEEQHDLNQQDYEDLSKNPLFLPFEDRRLL